MTESKKKYLLPSGFKDGLFDEAEAEFSAMVTLLDNFSEAGYRKIAPPSIEFAQSEDFDSLTQKFRFVDPISQQTLTLRSDITPQISRIAASRLSSEKLPLRVCYHGDIFQVNAINSRGDRQLKQVGLELLTQESDPKYDIEVLNLAIHSLTEIGLKNLTIDLNTPNLVGALDENYDDEVLTALDKKELAKLPDMLRKLTEYSGDAATAFGALNENLSDRARAQIEYVQKVCEGLRNQDGGFPANITVDFVESRAMGDKEKLSFSIFSQDVRDIVGRGGRYKTDNSESSLHAAGFSLYLNNFLQVLDN